MLDMPEQGAAKHALARGCVLLHRVLECGPRGEPRNRLGLCHRQPDPAAAAPVLLWPSIVGHPVVFCHGGG